jgi:hypothetical protein
MVVRAMGNNGCGFLGPECLNVSDGGGLSMRVPAGFKLTQED